MRLPTDIASTAVAPPDPSPAGEPRRAPSQRELADTDLRSALPQRGDADRPRASRSGTSVVMPAQGSGRAVWVVRRPDEMQAREIEASIESSDLDDLIADWAGDVIDGSMAEPDRDAGGEVVRTPVLAPHRPLRDPLRGVERGPSPDDPRRGRRRKRDEREPDGQKNGGAPGGEKASAAEISAGEGSAWDAMPASRIATPRHRHVRSPVSAVTSVQPARRTASMRSDDRIAPKASDASSAILWALAAMVVAIVVSLLTAVFRESPSEGPPGDEASAAQAERSQTRHDGRSR